ncbi:hypothetical protein NDU88_001221, partial [Pleurodeles waltl]
PPSSSSFSSGMCGSGSRRGMFLLMQMLCRMAHVRMILQTISGEYRRLPPVM